MTQDVEEARRTAQDAIRFAHLAMEMLARIIPDMQRAGVLRPHTKSEVMDVLREALLVDHDLPAPSGERVRRLADAALLAMKDETPLERELKRKLPE